MLAAFIAALLVAAPDAKSKPFKCDPTQIHKAIEALYTIKAAQAGERVPLFKEPRACPAKGNCTSRDPKVTLAIGDAVLVAGAESNGFRCVAFGTPAGALSTGYLPVANLEHVSREDNEFSQGFLHGSWLSGQSSLELEKIGDDRIRASGNASVKLANGEYATGEINADAKAEGKEMLFVEDSADEDTCRVTLRRRGPYVLAEDNNHCGGPAVRFDGVYVKVTEKKSGD